MALNGCRDASNGKSAGAGSGSSCRIGPTKRAKRLV